MRFIKSLVIAALAASVSCSVADVSRLFRNVDLKKKGIRIKLSWVPRGLYESPFVIPFDKMLNSASNGAVRVRAFNVYTVGNHDKISPGSIPSVANFLDPKSKFKDAWFGVYIILDDDRKRGRRFILKNPNARPDDPANLNDRSLLLLPKLDQKSIVWSTHQNQHIYTRKDFAKEFYFDLKKDAGLRKETIIDNKGRSWYKITGEFNTIAALTDVSKTDMRLFSSIRNYVGLPDHRVYEIVDPWHPVVIKGSVLARYFFCRRVAFWAVAYYNGSAFTTKKGERIDNWEQTDLRTVMEKMFKNLDLDCARD
ncbi:MAG: hypothetical protein A2W19_03235 [Spirochaetes bacterium RBG_16_49_21]|nr:MAG: hypothetical protein A2W19_03235 [Spirochaetes bacterium RBG_16_49_21]